MGIVKNFTIVTVNLIGDLWLGVGRKPEFYDNHTKTKTRLGYGVFVALAGGLALGTVIWLCMSIY